MSKSTKKSQSHQSATQKPVQKSTKHTQSADGSIQNFNQVNYLKVTDNQQGQRIDNFLLARLKGLPKSHVYKLIRSDEVRINNKRCKPRDKLYAGDTVRIAPIRLASRDKPVISQAFADGLKQRVVYEDDGLLVIDKPSGMAVHGGSGVDFGVIEAMREATGKPYLELIHRIDKDTSGLLMIAKKRSTLKKLQQYLREKRIQKHYLCLVKGHLVLNEQRIEAPLLRYTLANGERRVRVDTKDEQAKPSQTQIYVKDRFYMTNSQIAQSASLPVSLVEALPMTGRTHQIRVHMAHLGHPLLGDDKYHLQDNSDVRRLCLHAWRLDIPEYPMITANLPEDMARLLTENEVLFSD